MVSFNFPNWDALSTVDYSGSFWNSQDISDLNATIIRTALNLKEVTKQISVYERQKVVADLEYKRKFREAILNASGRTETQKKYVAEVLCEDLEANSAFLEEVLKELGRISLALRHDLDTLKTIGHNLRQELRL